MDFINNIEPNSFLLIPFNIKDKVLDYIDKNNLLLNIKIITFNDLKKGLFYDYDNKTIYELMKKENTSYSLAKNYIDNTYYIVEDKYDNKKLNKLLEIKNYLLNNNLLIKDDLFKYLLKSKNKLYVYGFDYIDKYNSYLLDITRKYIEIEIINKENNNYEHTVYEADTIEEEVIFVAEEITKLIKQNIDINKIYISGIDNDYDFTIRRVFKSYKIPFFNQNQTLYDTSMYKYFYNNLSNNIDELLDNIKNKYDLNLEQNSIVYNKLIELINKYYWANIIDVKEIIDEESKEIILPSIHMEKEIKSIDIYNNIINDDEYIFLMNFNMGIFPIIKKDEDYISDSIKPNFLEKTKEYNTIYKRVLINNIKNIKNLTITYKLSSPFNKYYPSYLIENNFEVKKINFKISNYSNDINKILFSKKLDNLIKFNEKCDELKILNKNYDIPYLKYDNKFKGLNNKIENINYSYSNISTFYKCPFRFYCENILKIDEFNDNLNTFIGSLFHHILENCLNSEIDIEYDKYVNEHKLDFNNHDYYFIEKLRQEIHIIVDIIKEQYKNITNYKEKYEQKIVVNTYDLNINTKINSIIKGFVDKIIQIDNDLIIIDYKTGSSDIVSRDMFEYGLHIQLPLYLYLIEEVNPNLNVAGIYLQYILTGNNKKDLKKSKLEIKYDELKLDGLTLDDKNIISKFDSSYSSSNMIKSLKVDKNGNLPIKRIYTYEQKKELKELIKKLIKNCVDNVYEGNFKINPIFIKDKEDGCKYCSFKDVCFKKQSDVKVIIRDGDNSE